MPTLSSLLLVLWGVVWALAGTGACAQSAAPAEQSAAPAVQPAAPSGKAAAPAGQPAAPAGKAAAPSDTTALLPKPAPAPKDPSKTVRDQTDAWFKDCKQGWGAATHMSRKAYERTCLRMSQERIKFMRDWEKNGGDGVRPR